MWNNCYGSHTYSSGNKYVGEWWNHKREGQGIYTYASSGNKYVGEQKRRRLGMRANGINKPSRMADAGTLFPRSVCRDSRTETPSEQTI